MDTLANRIKAKRGEKNLSQAQLARLSRVNKSTIAKIEAGGTDLPRMKNLEALANVLGKTPMWLLFGVDVNTKCDCKDDQNVSQTAE